jgi:hypothetical protein
MSKEVLASKCRELRKELAEMKYSGYWNESRLLSGSPEIYLKLLHFFFLEYSTDLKKQIADRGYILWTATDLVFVQQIFRMLQTDMNYALKLTVDKFLKEKFALLKLNLCCELAKMIRDKYKPSCQ